MAVAKVTRADLQAGDLPRLCVATGQPADGTVSFRFNSLPTWTWILLLFGVFPFLVAAYFAGEHVEGEVPVVRDVVERYHRRRRWAFGLATGGVVLLVAAAITSVPWLPALGVVAIAAGVVAGVAAAFGFVDGRVEGPGDRVTLIRVHPAFVNALHARDRSRAGRPPPHSG